jgi:signal transduction histidine kinase
MGRAIGGMTGHTQQALRRSLGAAALGTADASGQGLPRGRPAEVAALTQDAYFAMIAGISRSTAHALGNPLTGLSLSLDLLATTPQSETVQRLVERCVRITERLSAFKEDLGALGGSLRAPCTEVAVPALLDAALAPGTLDAVYAASVEIDPAVGPLVCHPGLMSNALGYLVRNVLDAMPDGGRFGLRAQALPDGVRLTVWDEGPGMPPELEPRLFVAPVSTKANGGGMGLLLVAMIVEHIHGGQVVYASGDPCGCQFHLDIPGQPRNAEVA